MGTAQSLHLRIRCPQALELDFCPAPEFFEDSGVRRVCAAPDSETFAWRQFLNYVQGHTQPEHP